VNRQRSHVAMAAASAPSVGFEEEQFIYGAHDGARIGYGPNVRGETTAEAGSVRLG
jgi:hypothetical protein